VQQRLQKLISAAGLASRRAAEEMILRGHVTINGQTATLGQSADPDTDDVRVDGKKLSIGRKRTYIMLNKPRGYVTTLSDERGRRTVAELVRDVGVRLYPVGRLDMDSEGLLIMTDDGELANALMHPSHGAEKTYETTVSGADMEQALPILRSELEIDGYRIRPAQVELKHSDGERHVLLITISEGRNRQVRKMCAAAGLRVHRLRRVSEGALRLGSLPTGQWRPLTENEIQQLKKII
jgi:23S rRNA pseudouridine2605 synthase